MMQHTVACLLIAFFSCLSFSIFTQAETDEDYKVEIMQHIIDRCFEYSASKSELLRQMSEEEVVTLMKLMSSNQLQETIDVTLPMVQDKPGQNVRR